jgi:hypothetical protein
MYTIYNVELPVGNTIMIQNDSNRMWIPMVNDNTDYQRFKKDIQNGAVLNDADGNAITGTELTTFISTLP